MTRVFLNSLKSKKQLKNLVAQNVVSVDSAQFSLPAMIEGTSLIAQRLASYDGPFLEDGSQQEVVNVAALVVYNAGAQEVRQTGIVLEGNGTMLCFYGETIPPGQTVLLLERNRRCYQQMQFTCCTGWQVEAKNAHNPSEYCGITDSAMGAVTVTNITQRVLEEIHLYYKAWLSPPDIFIGGITRQITIPVLQPGESVTIYPSHYACGYTKILSLSLGRI